MGEDLADMILEEDVDERDLMHQPEDPTACEVNTNDEISDARNHSPVTEIWSQ